MEKVEVISNVSNFFTITFTTILCLNTVAIGFFGFVILQNIQKRIIIVIWFNWMFIGIIMNVIRLLI